MEKMYAIKYYGDEIQIWETDCLQVGNCTCKENDFEVKCGYSAQEAKQRLVEYYRSKANYLEKQSLEDFLYDQGYYGD